MAKKKVVKKKVKGKQMPLIDVGPKNSLFFGTES